ncbi:MAG: cbb3-type cytochrome oxidase assembly protein CcoS [Pseudomonadota bacterium]
MNALYFLIPMTLLILGGAVAIFFWSLKRGQYEDMDSPAHRIIIEDREERDRLERREQATRNTGQGSPPDA